MLDKDLKLVNILAFAVLMQDIQTKSPDYVREKFARFGLSEDSTEWEFGLDAEHSHELMMYLQKWGLFEKVMDKTKFT